MSAPSATAARRFFTAAIRDYGIREGHHVRIPMRQCELARRRNIAPSTVAAHLNAMGEAVIARHPHIVLADPSSTAPTDLSPTAPTPEPPANPDDVLGLVVELLDIQTRLVRLLLAATTTHRAATDAANFVHDLRGSAEDPRETRGSATNPREIREGREDREGQERMDEQDLPSFHPSRGSATDPRDIRGSERLDELLEPLHRACRELHLPPLNNRQPLDEAIAGYTDQEIRDAVIDLVREVRTGPIRITSPFGLLIARCRQGLLPRQPGPASPRQPEPSTSHGPSPSDGSLAVVTAYEADPAAASLLEELDEMARAEIPDLKLHQLPVRARRALRAEQLRKRAARVTSDTGCCPRLADLYSSVNVDLQSHQGAGHQHLWPVDESSHAPNSTIGAPPRTVTISHGELARLLHVHRSTLRRMSVQGTFPAPKLGFTSRPRYARLTVERWLLNGLPDTALAPPDYRLLTASEAAAALGVSRATAYRSLPRFVEPVIVGVEARYPACRVRAVTELVPARPGVPAPTPGLGCHCSLHQPLATANEAATWCVGRSAPMPTPRCSPGYSRTAGAPADDFR